MSVDTALDIIKIALKKARVLGTGDILSDEDAQDSLSILNMMIESWSLDNLLIYNEQLYSLTLNGSSEYTVGISGYLNIERPDKLVSAFTSNNGVNYPIKVLDTAQEYDSLRYSYFFQRIYSSVSAIWYERSYPLGVLHVSPVSSGIISLRFNILLQQFPSLTTQLSLPIGYKKAIVDNLACELAQINNTDIAQTVISSAVSSLSRIKRSNSFPAKTGLEVSRMASRRYWI